MDSTLSPLSTLGFSLEDEASAHALPEEDFLALLRREGSAWFARAHDAYLRAFKPWVRAAEAHGAAVAARKPNPELIERTAAEAAAANRERLKRLEELMAARAIEELARYGTAARLAALAGASELSASFERRRAASEKWARSYFSLPAS